MDETYRAPAGLLAEEGTGGAARLALFDLRVGLGLQSGVDLLEGLLEVAVEVVEVGEVGGGGGRGRDEGGRGGEGGDESEELHFGGCRGVV